jgi:hypothetical protein
MPYRAIYNEICANKNIKCYVKEPSILDYFSATNIYRFSNKINFKHSFLKLKDSVGLPMYLRRHFYFLIMKLNTPSIYY